MSVAALQDQLSERLESFSQDAVLSRADSACDLAMLLLEREGAFTLDNNGKISIDGRPMRDVARDITQIVSSSCHLFCGIYEGGALLTQSSDILGAEAPADVQVVCTVREQNFYGPTDIDGRLCLVSAKAIVVGDHANAFVITGSTFNESNTTLLSLTAIQTEILALADELQLKRQHSVAEFVKSIRSIAKRIHLLALNASILSAQAGEHGRGFAVVAREIGELAERTRQSTQELEQELLGNGKGVSEEILRSMPTAPRE